MLRHGDRSLRDPLGDHHPLRQELPFISAEITTQISRKQSAPGIYTFVQVPCPTKISDGCSSSRLGLAPSSRSRCFAIGSPAGSRAGSSLSIDDVDGFADRGF